MDNATYERMLGEAQELSTRIDKLSLFIDDDDKYIFGGLKSLDRNLARTQLAAMEAYHWTLCNRIDRASSAQREAYMGEEAAQVCVGGDNSQSRCDTEDEYLANDRRTAALQLAIGYNSSVRDGMPPEQVIGAAEAFEDYLRGSRNTKQAAAQLGVNEYQKRADNPPGDGRRKGGINRTDAKLGE